jgi:cyclic pyranopterin phosphate synthase
MVDVTPKEPTHRRAVVRGRVHMRPETTSLVARGAISKGDVLAVARVAGIQAAKRTPELIPLCHPLRLTRVDVSFEARPRRGELTVQARVRTVDKTGVEMEALTAAGVAALTIYDMVKALEKGVTIAKLQLLEKSGGKSGDWRRRS